MTQRKYSAEELVDQKKNSHRVHHNILQRKLDYYGIKDTVNKKFNS